MQIQCGEKVPRGGVPPHLAYTGMCITFSREFSAENHELKHFVTPLLCRFTKTHRLTDPRQESLPLKQIT